MDYFPEGEARVVRAIMTEPAAGPDAQSPEPNSLLPDAQPSAEEADPMQLLADDVAPAEHDAGSAVYDDFAGLLGDIGAPPQLIEAIVDGFADTADYSARDAEERRATEAELLEVWGGQYGANVEAIRSYLTHSLPPGVGNLVMNARVKGRALLNDVGVAMYLQQVATTMPAVRSTGDLARDIAALEAVMGDDPQRYRRDLGVQARLRALYRQRG